MENEPVDIDILINRLMTALRHLDPETNEYKAISAQLKELAHVKVVLEEHDNKVNPPKLPWHEKILSNGPLVSGILTLAGIAWLTQHEKLNVVTSRAFGLLRFK